LNFQGKTVLIIGGGIVGERKAAKLLTAGAKVVVVSKDFTERLRRLSLANKLQLTTADLEMTPEGIRSLASNADFVIAATNQSGLNRRIAEEARQQRKPVNVVDSPHLGDFTMPDISRVGAFHIAISTRGKSPAMASLLRKRIEETISEEDIMMVRLQAYARKLAKARIANQRSRRKTLRMIIEDSRVRRLLKERNFPKAKNLAKRIIEGQESYDS
jgi:siroheme synthase-like protein